MRASTSLPPRRLGSHLPRRRVWVRLGTLLAVAAVGVARAAAADPPVVSRVILRSPIRIDEDALRRHLPLKVGEPFSERAVTESVERLLDKELFRSVEPRVSVQGGQAEVEITLDPHPVAESVDVRGEHAVDEGEILRRARVRSDEIVDPEELTAAMERVRELYVGRGFVDAKVAWRSVSTRPPWVRLTITVEEGVPVTVASVEIEGLEPPLEADALAALPVRPGAVLGSSTENDGREALTRFLRRRGHYEADVTTETRVADKSATLRFEVVLGPRFVVEIEGNRQLAAEPLLELTDVSRRPIVTDGTWRLIASRMADLYRERGFAFASVRVSVEDGDPKRVRFRIDEGEQIRVESLTFEGEHGLPEEELLDVVATRSTSGSPFAAGSDLYRAETLEADLEAVRSRYRRSGYLEAEVEEVRYDAGSAPDRLRIVVVVREGPRSVVERVEIEGDEELARGAASLRMQPGRPFRTADLEEDRRTLTARLAERGFVDARIETATTAASEDEAGPRGIVVRHVVTPGEAVRIGEILVRQNYTTLDRVVRRELPFRTGDPFDPAKLLEGQTRIYRLGIFRSVAIRPVQTTGPVRDVSVTVAERPVGELEYGFGYNTQQGLRNFVQIGSRNLYGTARQASIRADLNLSPGNFAPDEYLFSLDGREPRVEGTRTDLRGNVAFQRSEREIDEFSIRRLSVSAGPEREFRVGLRGALLFEFEDSDVFDVAPDAVLTGQDVGRLRIGSVNPTLVYDGRDDAFAPTSGVFESLRIRYGAPGISDVHFLKFILQHSQYVALGRHATWIYAARVGFARPLGDSITIPLRERFFLGGRTTVRGYDENAIGPRGEDGNPIGGDLSLNANTELRFPLFYGLGGAVFVDAGALYLQDRAISLGDVRAGVGPGLRYQTPVGAISLDFGFKTDRRRDESIGEVHFTIGNLF